MTQSKLSIRQMCDMFDVTPRTLRFYEAKELIAPERIGQRRLYGKTEVGRLKLIMRGKKFGFSLEDIRQLLALYHVPDQQQTQLKRTYALALGKLESLRQQRNDLDQTIAELEDQLNWGAQMLASQHSKTAAE